ncbi:GGDEF domain-containing protein [Alteromonas gilva]|uniref:diguanylate cyclase n=1 Tax=Alteromonas gilva TaxID=2987522 RepID=A0ABT5KZU3_9ALTE|nr:GGDEF domain-containing protein [Alteromonas gilva]MDC8830292.1 GGDEF domain-containing protein [Alteromonas gilva]
MSLVFLNFSTISRLKILLFAISIALVLGYDLIPDKTQQVFPTDNAVVSLFSDKEIGGTSSVRWIDQAQTQYECSIGNGVTSYCGSAITWWDGKDLTLDLSNGFDKMLIDVTYQGNAPTVQIIVRSTFYSTHGRTDVPDKAMASIVDTADLTRMLELKLKDFRVLDWWISENKIAPSDTHPDWRDVITMGVNSSKSMTSGPEQITINSVVFSGRYFTKEQLYLSLLIIWGFIFVSQGLWHYFELQRRVKADEVKLLELAAISEQYRVQAETDVLTGLSNREGLAQTLSTIERMGELDNFAMLILDIDYFKQVNDNYGHDVGDQVLEEIAQLIKQNCRQTDLVSRWGGEEFIVLFRCKHADDTKRLAENIRLEIARKRFSQHQLTLTATIGATKLSQQEGFTEAFKRADTALYKGKQHGRNMLVLA